jgi:hypothetical protein
MSKRIYTTANGKRINIDTIIAQNEESIAVGNMKVNARGDELGPGGRIERPRDKVMSDYYKLNTPVATDNLPKAHQVTTKKDLVDDWVESAVTAEPKIEEAVRLSAINPTSGSLAGSIAKTQPAQPEEPTKTGPTRI